MNWPDWTEEPPKQWTPDEKPPEASKPYRRVVVISDLHSGHRAGLTPPEWWGNLPYDKWADLRSLLWKYYAEKIDSLKPIDILMVNGDCIDGRGERSGSTELIAVDRFEQCDMASKAIKYAEAGSIVISRGTPYHTGQDEDYEDYVARGVGAVKIADHLWPEVNGVIFDVKHTVGSTSIPHGKGTAISKERLWNLVWNDFDESQPKADVIIRSHVHYFFYSGEPTWLGVVTPALQGMGSKYGSRLCRGIVHFGLIYFDIYSREQWLEHPTWGWYILRGATQKETTLTL